MTALVAAALILAQQTPDGAITMSKLGPAESTVIPYYGCFAAQGLADVYSATGEPRYFAAARKWADWYAAHQNPDGTIFDYKGHDRAWRSTGEFDSTDSYAAVYLSLLDHLQAVAPHMAWLRAKKTSIDRAVSGIRLTLQPCGLTTAKPDYPAMYTMDNVETLLGLRAASRLAGILRDPQLANSTKKDGDRMESAISNLEWDQTRSCYRVGVQTDGGKMGGLTKWYPDVMANLMAIGWLPTSPRNRELLARLKNRFSAMIPAHVRSQDDIEHLVWWGWAAKGAGDRPFLVEIRTRLAGFESACPDGCDAGLLGHVARLSRESTP